MTLVWMVPVTGLAAVLFALWLARDVLKRDTGTPAMQEIAGMIFEGAMAFLRRQYRTIGILAVVTAVAVAVLVGSISDGVKPIQFQNGQVSFATDVVIGRWQEGLLTGIAFLVGAFVLRTRRLHRHVHRRPLERTNGGRRTEEPEGRGHGLASRWRRFGLPGRGAEPPRRLGHLPRLQPNPRPPAGDRAVPHRRLRLRRQLRGAVRPARRRYLHEGGRCRRGPRRQGRSGHPGGRPAQRRRRRGPRGRQRRRLRRPRRRPVRIHVRREHRRDDPRRRHLLGHQARSSGSCSRWCCGRSASSPRWSA